MAHVIWDWNGTLLDDLPIVVEAVNACLRSQGAPSIDADTYRSRFVRPLNGFYEGLLGRPVDDDFLLELDNVFQDAYWDGFDDAELNAEAEEAIRSLASAGVTQSIASMLWHDMLVPTVGGFGLDDFMVALDGNRGTVGESKDQHMVHHVERLRRMYPELGRQTMTVIGDLVDDAGAARAADVGCVLYDGGSQPRQLLEGEGVPVVDSLLEAALLVISR
ncbi:MAG: HAD family hydrolase [Acidobacteria bacterium]|nr:HAD family hydrolase [Acidobacteriota bacterium]